MEREGREMKVEENPGRGRENRITKGVNMGKKMGEIKKKKKKQGKQMNERKLKKKKSTRKKKTELRFFSSKFGYRKKI